MSCCCVTGCFLLELLSPQVAEADVWMVALAALVALLSDLVTLAPPVDDDDSDEDADRDEVADDEEVTVDK